MPKSRPYIFDLASSITLTLLRQTFELDCNNTLELDSFRGLSMFMIVDRPDLPITVTGHLCFSFHSFTILKSHVCCYMTF